MTVCSVVGCKTRSEKIKKSNISLHKFPQDPLVRSAWIRALRRTNWQPSSYSLVCSLHFPNGCFKRNGEKVTLLKGAVPTFFPTYPAYYRKQQKKTRPYLKKEVLKSYAVSRKSPRPLKGRKSATSSTSSPKDPPGRASSPVDDSSDDSSSSETDDDSEASASEPEQVAPLIIQTSNQQQKILNEFEKLKNKLERYTALHQKSAKEIKILHQKRRRMEKKQARLLGEIETLKKKNFEQQESFKELEDQKSESLFKELPEPNREFLTRQLSKELKKPIPATYSNELKAFALTLHYLSAPAYRYVHKVFGASLPHERTIKKWHQVDGKPAFTAEACEFLKDITDLDELLASKEPKPKEPESHTCDICHKKLGKGTSLKTHRLTHTGEKPYSCDICQKAFSQKYNLQRHIMLHTGVKPHSCEVCFQAFSQKALLKAHMSVHTGVKPFNCPTCNKGFTANQHLKRHILVHTGEKPHTCDICHRGFTQKNHLKKHRQSHLDGRPPIQRKPRPPKVNLNNRIQHQMAPPPLRPPLPHPPQQPPPVSIHQPPHPSHQMPFSMPTFHPYS